MTDFNMLEEMADAAAEAMIFAWEEWCAEHNFPVDACEPEHQGHCVYEAWESLTIAVDAYYQSMAYLPEEDDDDTV